MNPTACTKWPLLLWTCIIENHTSADITWYGVTIFLLFKVTLCVVCTYFCFLLIGYSVTQIRIKCRIDPCDEKKKKKKNFDETSNNTLIRHRDSDPCQSLPWYKKYQCFRRNPRYHNVINRILNSLSFHIKCTKPVINSAHKFHIKMTRSERSPKFCTCTQVWVPCFQTRFKKKSLFCTL